MQKRRPQIALEAERRDSASGSGSCAGNGSLSVTSPAGEVKYAEKLKYGALKYSPSLGASAEWL